MTLTTTNDNLLSEIINSFNPDKFYIPKNDFIERGFWCGSDSEENYEKQRNHKLQIYGPEDITYKPNSHGYRCEEFDFKQNPKSIVYIGCSHTVGVGLPIEDTWSFQIHKLICGHCGYDFKYYNLSKPSVSNDYISRMAFHAKKLNPFLVIIMFTHIERRETNDNGKMVDFYPGIVHHNRDKKFRKMVTLNDVGDDVYNLIKNYNSVSSHLSDIPWCFFSAGSFELNKLVKNTYFYEDERYINFYIDWGKDFARDILHAGPKVNSGIVDNIWKRLPKFIDSSKTT